MRELIMRQHSIYCAASKAEHRVKVGRSHEVARRIAALRRGCPDLTVVRVWPLGVMRRSSANDIERRIHRVLRCSALGQEWYGLTGGAAVRLISLAFANLRRSDAALQRWCESLEKAS
jgi:hypothetical protein